MRSARISAEIKARARQLLAGANCPSRDIRSHERSLRVNAAFLCENFKLLLHLFIRSRRMLLIRLLQQRFCMLVVNAIGFQWHIDSLKAQHQNDHDSGGQAIAQ